MTVLVVLSVADIVLLIAGLAVYLFWVGTLLTRIAANLEECAEIVASIVEHAKLIGPGVEHINETGGVVAGALPLLYGMAEEIVADVTADAAIAASAASSAASSAPASAADQSAPIEPPVPEPARPASGTRRSRLLHTVGYDPR
jgi:hypothetical protein